MNKKKDEKWLDELISRTINTTKPEFDVEKWKQKYPQEFQMLLSRARQPSPRQPNIWRTILKSPITKLAAAAAVIIIAVLIGIHQLGGSIGVTSKVYAVTDVPKLLTKARTIHIKGWTSRCKVPVLGEEQDRRHTEQWIDVENGRFRTMGFGLVTLQGHLKAIRLEHVFDGQYRIQINHSSKRVQFYRLSDFKRKLNVRKVVNDFLGRISLATDELTGFERIGQGQISGMKLDIWEKKISDATQQSEKKLKYWLSPTSGDIRKFQHWEKGPRTNGKWQLTKEENIELNVVPPEGIFETTVPEGYRSVNNKEMAFTDKLITYPISFDTIKGAIAIIIALPDGTAIMGWYSNDASQADLFENLKPGEELPKMGLEIIYGLRPKNNTQNITYVARHLAHTQKDGRFYEWDIYVPNKEVAARSALRDCQIIMRLHPENGKDAETKEQNYYLGNVTLFIEEEEFDTWVLGAMAELSDNGKPPEGITYESVLQLARQIRESLPN